MKHLKDFLIKEDNSNDIKCEKIGEVYRYDTTKGLYFFIIDYPNYKGGFVTSQNFNYVKEVDDLTDNISIYKDDFSNLIYENEFPEIYEEIRNYIFNIILKKGN